jgi:hypothetical protein
LSIKILAKVTNKSRATRGKIVIKRYKKAHLGALEGILGEKK